MIAKIFKGVYYAFIGFIVLTAVLLIVSIVPITGNFKVLVVQSGSMEPKIRTGSIVVVKPAIDYKIGEVITFGPMSKTKAPTTHRITDIKIEADQPIYLTKGDANNAADQREVTKREVIGKVLFSAPFLGYVVNFAKKPLGFLLIIIVPAIIIIYDEIRKIVDEIKNKKKSIETPTV